MTLAAALYTHNTQHNTLSSGLAEVLITGGIPPAIADRCPAERTYTALFRRVLAQNARYYARFPGDAELVGRIVRFLAAQPGGGALLPSGTRLTPRALQLLGLSGLGSSGERRGEEGGRARRGEGGGRREGWWWDGSQAPRCHYFERGEK